MSSGSPDRFSKVALAIGIVGVLVPWGLQLIGVAVNVWLGGVILAVAFGFIVYASWIWERSTRWHVALRGATIVVAGALYFTFVGRQMISEYKKGHKPVTTTQELTKQDITQKGQEGE